MRKSLNKRLERTLLWAADAQNNIRKATNVEVPDNSENVLGILKHILNDLTKTRGYALTVPIDDDCNPSFEEMDQQSIFEPALAYYVFSKWKKWKTAYVFDPAFLDELLRTEDTGIRLEMLRRLPCPSFFIDAHCASCNSDDISGYFVSFDFQGKDDCFVAVMSVANDEIAHRTAGILDMPAFYLTTVVLHDGETIDESSKRILRQLDENDLLTDRSEEHLKTASQLYMNPVKVALACAYYLASQNADNVPLKLDKKERPKRKNGTPLNIRAWEVGFRMGRDIGKLYRYEREGGKKPHQGGTKRPHVRCAHWHHYWTGPGKTELTLKWLAPTIVNGESDDLPAVGRRVLKEDTDGQTP